MSHLSLLSVKSIGRVQGPTLAFVVHKEIDIRKHIPDPHWSISADFEKN